MAELAGDLKARLVVRPSHVGRHVLARRPAGQGAGKAGEFLEALLRVFVPQAVRSVQAPPCGTGTRSATSDARSTRSGSVTPFPWSQASVLRLIEDGPLRLGTDRNDALPAAPCTRRLSQHQLVALNRPIPACIFIASSRRKPNSRWSFRLAMT